MSLDCADFLTLFLSTSPLGHLVCLMLISSDAENNNRYYWNWSLKHVSQLLENFWLLLSDDYRLLQFISYFWAPEWHFKCNFVNDQENVWFKNKAHWLANIWFSCSGMLFFCDHILKKLSACEDVALDPTGSLLRPPDSHIIFFLFHFSLVPCLIRTVHCNVPKRTRRTA